MTQAVVRLTEKEEKDLRHYAKILKQYVNPEISQYFPIGWKKLPKVKRLDAQRIYQERHSLQARLGIEWKWGYAGKWKLEMIGLSENPGNLATEDLEYWNIMPLNSGRRELLEYLAEEVFPKVFNGKRFLVRDTMISCEGNCSWDCA